VLGKYCKNSKQKEAMKHYKAVKYSVIISWLLFFVAVTIWSVIHYHFYQLGLLTDEDWFESGLTFSIWGTISMLCTFVGLFSPFIAIISTGIYIAERIKYKKQQLD
jgi:hypothetical protein